MNLFVLRHASAGNRRPNPLLDAKRPLDKEGKQFCLQLAKILQAMKVQFDAIYSSPLKRALQTAVLTGTENGYEAPVQQTKSLSPDATPADFHKLVQDVQHFENVLLVGHSPNIESFLGLLLVPQNGGTVAKVRLRKGSIARVSIQRGSSQLMWLLDPRTVRALDISATRRKTSKRKSAKPKSAKSRLTKSKPPKK